MSKAKSQNRESKSKKGWKLWNDEEKILFYQLQPFLKQNYKEFTKYFPERSYTQIKSFFHNYFRKSTNALKELAQSQDKVNFYPPITNINIPQSQEQPIFKQQLENHSYIANSVDNLSYNSILDRVANILHTKQ